MRTPSLAAALALALAAPGPVEAETEPHVAPDHERRAIQEAPQDGAPEAEAAEEAMTRDEELDRLFARLATAEEGAHAKIERDIRRLLSRSGSDSMDLLLMRGRDAMEDGEVVRAIHHFTAAVQHDPDFAEAWNLRATAFYQRGDLGQALADIERVLALEPRHFGALSGLGVILDRIGRDADALTAYRRALAVNPHLERIREAAERLAPKVDGRDI